MSGYDELRQIGVDIERIGRWMLVEKQRCTTADEIKVLFRETQRKTVALLDRFKALKLTAEERRNAGLFKDGLKLMIAANKAGAAGRWQKAKRLGEESQVSIAKYLEVIRR
ncbi:hypothetical protein LC085_07695 [Bacillus tianshenii]|uniref:hypothetical protein n=1 Tax=Sutcliffiella tianshenii TaxID=1463404 RepID=UPI001CD7EA47|nr:hypothetical protein [Bacillus tianshenii]MCA1319795.1 hypothetical protein [Bacillus tianshenii]